MDYSENFFKSVEHRNAEFNSLLYGADYLKGLQINNLMRVVTKLDFKFLADAVRLKIADKMLNKYQKKRKFQNEPSGISTYESYQKLKKKRIVIYTCILGGYDTLKEPLLEFDNVTYICYTFYLLFLT